MPLSYKTSDGCIFANLNDAQEHEAVVSQLDNQLIGLSDFLEHSYEKQASRTRASNVVRAWEAYKLRKAQSMRD